jgi:hypothetical protein
VHPPQQGLIFRGPTAEHLTLDWLVADPFLVTRVVHMLDCVSYDGQYGELRWQRYDYGIDCDSTEYTAYSYVAWLMLLLYPIGIPVGAFWVFYQNRKRLLDRSHHRHGIAGDEALPESDRRGRDKTSIWSLLGMDSLEPKKPWWHGNRDTFYFMVRDYRPEYYYFVSCSLHVCLICAHIDSDTVLAKRAGDR